MSLPEPPYFFDEEALLDRLTAGVIESGRDVVFITGAPLTGPTLEGGPGVADVSGVTELIRNHFSSSPARLADLNTQLENTSNPYQTAFAFLTGRRGQDVANRIIRQAVWMARKDFDPEKIEALSHLSDDDLKLFENDIAAWNLSPAVEALGQLIALEPTRFGRAVITSNFDPLIQVAIKRAGGEAWRTALHGDVALGVSSADGCEIIHIHGFWRGSDTLHTGNQLLQKRPKLAGSLLDLLAGKTVVVMAYGGWEDVLTNALGTLVSNPAAFPEIVWTFFSREPNLGDHLKSVLGPGMDRNRVTFFSGIDCHTFMPRLVAEWQGIAIQRAAQTVSPTPAVALPVTGPRAPASLLPALDCDRPPSVETWVGRASELETLVKSNAKFVAICGIGGQGKSALAATYVKKVECGETTFQHWDWRDCREEGDRLRSQVIAAITRLSDEEFHTSQLAQAKDADLIEVFVRLSLERKVVFIFDNVDHHVDLENRTLVGFLDQLVKAFCRAPTRSRLVITCRPQIQQETVSGITLPMPGLSLSEAEELFAKRLGAHSENPADIATAHRLSAGHPFWLDLMAAKVASSPNNTLKSILEDVRRGRDDAPDFLSPMWNGLNERDRTVLRGMAEIVRPENEATIADIVSSKLNYNKFNRSMRSLISLNLIVVKREKNAPDLYDLHPLVRQFVRRAHVPAERVGFITLVLSHYDALTKRIAKMLGVHMPFSMLEHWSQKAEIQIEAGQISNAFSTLHEVHSALIGGGHLEEFVRVSRKLFEAVDWQAGPDISNHFDEVLSDLVSCLDATEQFADADDLLERYAATIPEKTARYIKYCNVRCHSFWQRGMYDQAIQWGRRGNDLKKTSNVDTHFDCEHNLALATRDGGDPETALKLFLGSTELDRLLSAGSTGGNESEEFSAPLFGNVGRCLFMMGRLDQSLVCLQRSAILLEDDKSSNRLENQAFARQWIAECLIASGDAEGAVPFLVSAEDILKSALPIQARVARALLDTLPNSLVNLAPEDAHRSVKRWLQKPIVTLIVNDNCSTAAAV